MNIQLKITGGTDKTTRFEVIINEVPCGELQTDRGVLTKIADKLFDNQFVITKQ